MNKYLNTVIIAPITTQSKKNPTRVEVEHENMKGWIVLDQISTIDKQRIHKTLNRLTVREIEKVKMTIKELLVD